jgi:hypothetical protein
LNLKNLNKIFSQCPSTFLRLYPLIIFNWSALLIKPCSSSHVCAVCKFARAQKMRTLYENIVSDFNRISNKPFLMKLLKCNWRGCMTWHDDIVLARRPSSRGEFIALCSFYYYTRHCAVLLRCYYSLLATRSSIYRV